MSEIKFINWSSIIVLLIVMLLMLLLDYSWFPLLLFIPIFINLLLIVWASSLEKSGDKTSYLYWFSNVLLLLFAFASLLPAILGLISIPNHIQRIPVYYSKENITKRHLEKIALQRIEQFKELKAPIENGIWVERREMQRAYDFDGTYVVPCINGKIHGEVKIIRDDWQKMIYFNQGVIDSIIFKDEMIIIEKTYRVDQNNYQQIINTQNNDEFIKDTSIVDERIIEANFWLF